MATAPERLMQDAIDLGRSAYGIPELLMRLGEKMKGACGADEVMVSEVKPDEKNPGQAQKAVVSTARPYLDNSLSNYSAFAELINYYKTGFRSCLLVPVATERSGFGVITLLSRREDGFGRPFSDTAGFAASMMAYQLELRVERERSNSLARYFDAAFENGVPNFIIERNGKIVKANKAGLGLFGLSGVEASGAELGAFLALSPELAENIRNGIDSETREIKGERRYRLSSHRIGENLTYVSLYDVSKLRGLEEKASLLAMSQGEAFMRLDKEMRIVWVGGNTDALKINAQSFLGRKLETFLRGEGREELSRAARELEGGIRTHYAMLELDNGLELGVNITLGADAEGFSVVISKDVERYVENVGRRIEDFVSLSQEFVIMIDEEGFIRNANRSAERLLGYNSGELDGVPISRICATDESRDRMSASLELARKRDTFTDFVVNLAEKGGGVMPFSQNIKALRDAESKITGYMIIGKELRTKKILEELRSELEEVGREAERQKQDSELKTQFIFNVSHELKTPRTNINGYAKLLMEGGFGELSPEQMESVKTIITEDDRLMQLIQQILDVAKLEAGKIKLDWQEVDLAEIRDNPSIKSLEEMVRSKGLDYEFAIDYSVPAIEADPNRLIQVFVNLIVNAYKFTDKGSITIKAYRKGKNVMVEVRDTGVGINIEEKNKLFKRFYQLQKRGLTKQEGSGTGLGLSIVKEIVSLHGGRVGLGKDTAPGKGSTFWFSLPIHRKPKKKEQVEKDGDKAG